MDTNTFECTSLCRVYEYNGKTRLERIADISNSKLVPPYKSFRDTLHFENRDWLHWNDGPRQIGTLAIWNWSVTTNANNPKDDYDMTFYNPDFSPVQLIIVPDISSVSELIEALENGRVMARPYICDTLFCYKAEWNHFDGVLCHADEFIVKNQYVTIDKELYVLPRYSITTVDIYSLDEKNLRFIKNIRLGEPTEYISIGDIRNLIKEVIIKKMSWPAYRDNIGKKRADWHECQMLFETVSTESVYDEILKKCKCPESYIKTQIGAFVREAQHSFDVGDIDAEIIARIAMNHDDLRTQCEAAVEEHWKTSHAEALAEAQKELDQKKQASENIINEYKTQFEKIKADTKAAEAARQKILTETAEAQAKLDQLLKEIEEYETLGTNTVQAIREKIGLAQQDMAGFIAELSTFIPQQSVQGGSENRWTFTHGAVCSDADSMEACCNWKDTLNLLCDNLQLAGIGSQWTIMLSDFLYSAYLNRMPLLLAGPNAKAIADALSMTICGQRVDLLKCCGEQDAEALSSFVVSDMVAVQNPFHPDWISGIPHSNNGFALWLHPFTEDLQIEPRSLYHYAYPVFTECFVDQLPSAENMDAGQKTVEYGVFKSDPKCRAKMGPIKKLGMSRLMLNRLERVLADAKCMGAISDTSMDMECLFGLLPMCILSGKTEVLPELLDSEKNIKPEVKLELQRYMEE